MSTPSVPSTRHGAQTVVEHSDPQQRRRHGDMSHIPGWGSDLDPARRPGVPMERTPPRLPELPWDEPPPQHVHVEVLHSVERPGITPIVGTSVPPSGMSGRLRELAFRFTEADLRHWMLLLLADRVNVCEGLAEDFSSGHVPNLIAEMGLKSKWDYDRANLVREALVVAAVAGAGLWLAWPRRGPRRGPRRPGGWSRAREAGRGLGEQARHRIEDTRAAGAKALETGRRVQQGARAGRTLMGLLR